MTPQQRKNCTVLSAPKHQNNWLALLNKSLYHTGLYRKTRYKHEDVFAAAFGRN